MGCCSNFNKREAFILFALGSVNFANSLCASLQAPFYPQEAEKKGATPGEYGLVFGVYELVSFISCPIFGKYIGVIGCNFMLNAGIVTTGTSAALFGALSMVNSHVAFITLSFIIRIIEALGAAASMTASFSITASAFPGSVATVFATLEIFHGVGFIVGPSIGGLLFQIGGFMMPFTVIGGCLLLVGLAIFFVLPPVDAGNATSRQPGNMLSVMTLPPVMFAVYSVVAASISSGYYEAILEPHIRQFHLSPVGVGGMFVITGGFYALTAPLVGRWCDNGADPKIVTVIGCVLIICSFLLVGPPPFMPFDTTFWVICIGLVFEGLGLGFIHVSSFIDAISSAISSGLPEDITTYGIVSGLMTSAFCLGSFIGPSVAGYLYEHFGFKRGSFFVLAVHGVLLVGLIVFKIVSRGKVYSRIANSALPEENEKLLLANHNSHPRTEETPVNLLPKKAYGSVVMEKDMAAIRWERDP